MADETQFDVLIPVASKDIDIINLVLNRIAVKLNPRKIVVAANSRIKDFIYKKENIEFCDEDELVKNLSLQTIKRIVNRIIPGADNRCGWYFQQFLKMGYAYKSESPYYLIWDSDTIPLNKLSFFNIENNEEPRRKQRGIFVL